MTAKTKAPWGFPLTITLRVTQEFCRCSTSFLSSLNLLGIICIQCVAKSSQSATHRCPLPTSGPAAFANSSSSFKIQVSSQFEDSFFVPQTALKAAL